ncbi:MAG: PAS domain S-box protein [Desulforhopalus sp.]
MAIRKRIILALYIILIPFLLLETFVFYRWFHLRKEVEMQVNLELARSAAVNFETFLQGLLGKELALGLAFTASRSLPDKDRDRILDKLKADLPEIRSLYWINPEGMVIASSLRSYIGRSLTDRYYFQKLKEGQDWAVSELVIDKVTKRPTFIVCRAIRDDDGKLLGIAAASVEPDRLQKIISINRHQDAGLSLLDDKGRHVTRYPTTEYSWEQRNWLKSYPIIGEALKGKEMTVSVKPKTTGKLRFVAFVPISSIGWVAAASHAESDIISQIIQVLMPQIWLSLLVTLTAFGAALGLSRPVIQSILKLKNHAAAIGHGQNVKIPAEGPHEVQILAATLNVMTEKIQGREADIRESESLYRAIAENFPDGAIFVFDHDLRFRSADGKALTSLGYSREALVGKTIWEATDEKTCRFLEELYPRVLAGESLHLETPLKGRIFSSAYVPIRGEKGKILAGMVVSIDITARKQAEEKLKLTQASVDVAGEMIAWFIPDGKICYANDATCRELGYSHEEILNMTALDFSPGFTREQYKQHWQEVRERKSFTLETTHRRKDGSEYPAEILVTHFESAEQEYIFAYGRDITERKSSEEALRESENLFRQLFDNAPLGKCLTTPAGVLERTNPAFCRMLGYSKEELALKSFIDITHPDDLAISKECTSALLAGKQDTWEMQKRYIAKDGHVVWSQVVTALLRDAQGKSLHFLTHILDITERKQAEEQRDLLMREIDHRAKNLLAVVQSVVQLTKADTIEEFAAAVRGRLAALARTHSLLAQGRWRGAHLESIISEEIEPYFKDDGKRFSLSGPPVVIIPEAVQSLGMVFHELATNAAKYGALSVTQGKVEVRWEFTTSGEIRLLWRESGGPQVREPKKKGFGSSLIGSAIKRQLGGFINCRWHSEGVCCEFSISKVHIDHTRQLQSLVMIKPVHRKSPHTASLHGSRILIVEDDMLIAAGIEQGLRTVGCEPVGPVGEINEAMELARSAPDLHAAVVDVNLHGQKSWPIIGILRERGVPYSLATGYGDLTEVEGNPPILEKPFSSKRLVEVMRNLLTIRK